MNMTPKTWTLIGWLLLFFGGWSYQSHAQDVPSKDVGVSTYLVPVFPGGQVNVYPYIGNFKYTLPVFKTSGVGPCTSFTLTYDTNNLSHEDKADSALVLSAGWQCDYMMRVRPDPSGQVMTLYLPWGGDSLGAIEQGAGTATYSVTFGFGFTGQITRGPGGPYHWALQVIGGRQYLFNSDGGLSSIVDPTGNRTDVVWRDKWRPAQVIDMVLPGTPYPGTGRVTNFEYYDATAGPLYNYMKAVVDPAGNRYDLSYGPWPGGYRLDSVLFPPVVINGVPQRPNHKFEYNILGSGMMSKVIPPRGAANGNYGYTLQYNARMQLEKVTDPPESYMDENGAITTTPPTFELTYFGNPAFTGDRYQHTTVKDRRGNPTVYVFHSRPLDPDNKLLTELWDATTLTGTPVPGIFPIRTGFDQYVNLVAMTDRWGNAIQYKFTPPAGPLGNWQKNLVQEVLKQGPLGGLIKVEAFTYTADVFSNVLTRTTWTEAGVSRTISHQYDGFGRKTFDFHPDVNSLPNAPAQTGITTQYVYDTVGRLPLKQVINERGNSTRYSNFDARHGLPQDEVRDGGSQPIQKQYDIMGNAIRTKLPQGQATNDLPNWVETILDSHYRVDKVTELLNGVVVTKMDYEYDLDGNVRSILPAGDAATPAQAELKTFDKRGLLVSIAGPDGTWTHTIDGNGNVRVKNSLRAHPTTFKYDKLNRLIEEITPGATVYGAGGGGGPDMKTLHAYDLGGVIGNTFDQVTRVGSGTANPDRVTKTFYDNNHRIREVQAADLRSVTRFKYDLQGQLVAKEHLYDGTVIKSEVTFRDERDRVFRQRVQPDAYTPGLTPSAASDVVTIPNAAGTIVEERDPLWSSSTPSAHRTVFGVDARERVTTTTNGLGVVVKRSIYGDDDQVNEVQVPDPSTKTSTLVTQETYRYTARKEQKEAFNRDGVRIALKTYRVREGVLDSITDAANVVNRTTYYPNTWRVDEVIHAQGTSFERRTKSVWAAGLLSETRVWNSAPGGGSSNPSVYRYFYDKADRLERFEYPGGILAPEQSFYNPFSEISQFKAQTKVGDYLYDKLGRVTSVAWSGPVTETFTSSYDEAGNLSSIYTTVPPSATIVRKVDTVFKKWLGTPDTRTFSLFGVPWQGASPTLDFDYDNDRNLRGLIDKEGGSHSWVYDADGRLQTTRYGSTSSTVNTVNAVTYTPGGLLSTTTIYNSSGTAIALTTHSYDRRGRKVRQQTVHSTTRAVLSDLQWEYNDVNLVTKIRFTHLGVDSTIGYNARREVTSEAISSNGNGLTPPAYTNSLGAVTPGAESTGTGPATARTSARLPIAARNATYLIDAAGNRMTQTITGSSTVTTAFVYNAASQLISETRTSSQTDKISHVYDIWGNEKTRTTNLLNDTTIDITEQYQYNSLGRLSAYTNSATGANWQYEFWPTGERSCKTNLTTSAKEHYIPRLDDVVADYQQVGAGPITLKNKYVQGITTDSKVLRIAFDGSRRHFVGDAVGTLDLTLDDTASIQQTFFKDVFGVSLDQVVSQERYNGIAQRERDSESGLDYVRARMYDPRTGRFTQTDSLLSNKPCEHYVYAHGNPVSRVDPSGLDDLTKPATPAPFKPRMVPQGKDIIINNPRPGDVNTYTNANDALTKAHAESTKGVTSTITVVSQNKTLQAKSEREYVVRTSQGDVLVRESVAFYYGKILVRDAAITFAGGVAFRSVVAIVEAEEAVQASRMAVEFSKVVRASNAGKRSVQVGQTGEAIATEITGVEQNTAKYLINGRERIPDRILAESVATRQPTHVAEVKNVKYQSYTKQLKDDVDLVGPNGKVDVMLPPNARVSRPLQRAFDDPTNPLNRVDLVPPKP
jgi:RHS repeat-associated protein